MDSTCKVNPDNCRGVCNDKRRCDATMRLFAKLLQTLVENFKNIVRTRERKLVTGETSDEEIVSDVAEQGRLRTSHFARVVAAVLLRHVCITQTHSQLLRAATSSRIGVIGRYRPLRQLSLTPTLTRTVNPDFHYICTNSTPFATGNRHRPNDVTFRGCPIKYFPVS